MRAIFVGLAALTIGAAVAVATFVGGMLLAPPTCPRCQGPICTLMACVLDPRGHIAAALGSGVVAAVLTVLAARRWYLRPHS